MLDKDDQIVRVWGKQHCPSIFRHVQEYLMKKYLNPVHYPGIPLLNADVIS